MYGIAFALMALMAVGAVSAFGGTGFDRTGMNGAIESDDYETWKALHEERRAQMDSLLTEENFQLLGEMKEAREGGDFDRVDEIRAKLGFPERGKGKGFGHHKMMDGDCPFTN